MRAIMLLFLTALLVSASSEMGAQEACFCLRHTESGATLRGCTAFKAPSDDFTWADCFDPVSGEIQEQKIRATTFDFDLMPQWR